MNYKKTISLIQKARSINNKNWMDLLRISFKYAPKESKKILQKINLQDEKISKLLKNLSK
tara:strand:- start:6477 stop:6656 length:180 start_codon:yes stop_codon:yes gene_type:complete